MPPLIHLSRTKVDHNQGALWEAINEFFAFADVAKLEPVHRIAYLAYDYSSAMEMGGHYDYFIASPQRDYSEVVSALQAVGANEQAGVLERAVAAVLSASKRVPDIYSDRFIAGIEFADLNEFDEACERCNRPVRLCLLEYVAGHEKVFIEWNP